MGLGLELVWLTVGVGVRVEFRVRVELRVRVEFRVRVYEIKDPPT